MDRPERGPRGSIASIETLESELARARAIEGLLRTQITELTLDRARLTARLEDLRRLQDAMAVIRGSISSRAPLSDVLDAIVGSVSDLLAGAPVGLYLVDPGDPGYMSLVAHRNLAITGTATQGRRRVGHGVAGRAVEEGRLLSVPDYPSSPDALDSFVAAGMRSVTVAPVYENGRPSGCLVVPAYEIARSLTEQEQAMLVSLAEHVSLALTDAKTVDAMLHQALHDALTGLPNRALFGDRLEQALVRARRNEALTAVLFLDLDRFKQVNDTLGHSAGDDMLIEVARRIDTCRRGADTAARLGGDEFAVLLESLDGVEEAAAVAERIIAAIEQPFRIHGRELTTSASIGIAIDEPEAADFMRHADVAMYRAKTEGRGRVVVFEPEMQDEIVDQMELGDDLRHAIERDEIELHYQPVVDVADGRLVGFEALARWRHPQRGVLAPDSFIALAEDMGMILDLGRHVLEIACDQASQWLGAMPSGEAFMSVNLSGHQLEDPALLEDVRRTLGRSGIRPDQLMLEIAETVLTSDTEATIRRLAELRQLGVRIAIDDFGTGYSSLRHLRRLPIDALKMAKPFVDALNDDEASAALARAIIDLAASLEIACIAEGIETVAQQAKLDELGCQLGQGFHFARPSHSQQLTALLRERTVDFPVS